MGNINMSIIDSDLAIGNAIIETSEELINPEYFYNFSQELSRINKETGLNMYIQAINEDRLQGFCNNYPFFAQLFDEGFHVVRDEFSDDRLFRYFRMGIPDNVLEMIISAASVAKENMKTR